jgi:integrase
MAQTVGLRAVSRGYLRGALTAHFVRTVSKPGKYHDGIGMGLMLRVTQSGSRQWVQRLMCGGSRVELGLGSPPVVTLDLAREKALANKRLTYEGKSPVEKKQDVADIPTLQEATTRAVAIQAVGKAEKYEVRFVGAMKLHVYPHIGTKKVNTLTSQDLNRVFESVIIKSPGVARKVIDYTTAVINWCEVKGFISGDILTAAKRHLPKIPKSDNKHVSLPYSKIHTFLDDLYGSNAGATTKLGLEFLVLTATRSLEMRGTLWQEIDFRQQVWTLPAHRTKERKIRDVPLSTRAMEILEVARSLQTKPCDLVFPSLRGKVLSDATHNKLIKESLKYDVDLHGFRSTFRTWAQEQNTYSEEACETVMGHAFGNSVRNAYARSQLMNEKQVLMQDWAAYVTIGRTEARIV